MRLVQRSSRFSSRQKLVSPWRILALALLAATTGCGEPIPPVSATSDGGVKPLVTVTMPKDNAGEWELPEGKARMMEFQGRTVLMVDLSDVPLEASRLIPSEARGAGNVLLRVMCDGEYRVGLRLGSITLPAIDGGNTRREWRELMFALPSPLAAKDGDRVTIVREPTKAPVLIEAIRFMP